MGSKIAAAEKGLYLIDPLTLNALQRVYEKFNEEFSPFLTDRESENFIILFKLTDGIAATTMSREYRSSYTGVFYLELLTQIAQDILDDV